MVSFDSLACNLAAPFQRVATGCAAKGGRLAAFVGAAAIGLSLTAGQAWTQPVDKSGTAKGQPVAQGKVTAAGKEESGQAQPDTEKNQEPTPPARRDRDTDRPAAPLPAAPVEDVGPDVYYLPDENGKLRPVPGWTLEDFRRLIEQQAAPGQAPAYSLNRLTAHGVVSGAQARVTVELTIQIVGQPQKRWVRVPLQMNDAILAEPAQTSRGNLILEHQPAQDGYVAWLRGVGEEPLVLTFHILLPIKSVGGEEQLVWTLPRVAPSQLKLQVPFANAEAEVSAGATLLPPVASPNGSELTVLGLGGELRLAWHAPDQQLSSRARLLEAEGAHLVRVERGLIRTQAQLAIRSLGGDFERVRVRLPRGARLVPTGPTPGYTIKALDSDPQRPGAHRPGAAGRPVVEIQSEKKTRGPLNVRFVCEQSYDVGGPQTFLDMATFEVEGAARHWGNIAVQVVGDWHLFWQDAANVRRVDSVPASLPSSDLTAAFEYSGQPYLLSARVAPPVTRVSVEPQYLISVSSAAPAEAAELKLEARLKCRVSGAKIFELPIDLAGWDLDEGGVGPASRVDLARVTPPAGGVLKIPLLSALKGEFEITLAARRRVKLNAGALTTDFPRPRVENVVPATVIVLADDNVQLTPRREALVSLVPLPVPPAIELPPRVQSPFFYRLENPAARLAADLQVHARTVTAETTSRVRLSQRVLAVQQSLDFEIAYEAVEWLSIQVPRELADPGALKVTLDGVALTPLEARTTGPGDHAAPTVDLRLPLPKPRIGQVTLHIDYRVPLSRAPSGEQSEVSLPLVMPAAVKMRRNELVLEPAAGTTAEIADRAWSKVDQARDVSRGGRGRRYQANGALSFAALVVGAQARPTTADVVIHRGWVQSWFSGETRHDQAAYLLSSREDRILVDLPAGAEAAASEVWLDGKPITPEVDASGSLVLDMPAADGVPHRLLLRYLLPRTSGWWQRASLPRFPEGTWVQKMYWQLVLSPDEHLLSAPASTTAEYLWRRLGWTWQRQSLLDERELAAWLGVAEENATTPVPQFVAPAAAQRYLLSLSNTGGDYWLPIVPRAALVLMAAGGVLCLGLLWIYIRQLRRPSVVFAATVALVAVGLLYPEPAIVLCQAATLGLGLIVLVALLRRWFGAAPPVPIRSASISNSGHSSTEFLYQPTISSSGSTGSARGLPSATSGASGSTRAAVQER